jgi:hypothetical protein
VAAAVVLEEALQDRLAAQAEGEAGTITAPAALAQPIKDLAEVSPAHPPATALRVAAGAVLEALDRVVVAVMAAVPSAAMEAPAKSPRLPVLL